MNAYEVNFDGLVGPTHNYSGLSFGNVASTSNVSAASNPKLAAKQGLAKMKALHDLGFKQGVLAPHERPDVASLRLLGFGGSDAEVVARAARKRRPSWPRPARPPACGCQRRHRQPVRRHRRRPRAFHPGQSEQ